MINSDGDMDDTDDDINDEDDGDGAHKMQTKGMVVLEFHAWLTMMVYWRIDQQDSWQRWSTKDLPWQQCGRYSDKTEVLVWFIVPRFGPNLYPIRFSMI